MSQIPFNEEETGNIILTFTDKDGKPITPDSATYTLYDQKTKAIINSRENTAIPGLDATVNLELVPDDNLIIDDTLDIEEHVIFVQWVYNIDKQGKQESVFNVINLEKIS